VIRETIEEKVMSEWIRSGVLPYPGIVRYVGQMYAGNGR